MPTRVHVFVLVTLAALGGAACDGATTGGSTASSGGTTGSSSSGGRPAGEPTPSPGRVTGWVRTRAGVPIAGALVEARQEIVGSSTTAKTTGTSGADGTYALELRGSVAPWVVSGAAALSFEGVTYDFALVPDSTEPFVAEDGAVRNLVLDPRSGGSSVSVVTAIGDPTSLDEVTLTLVPEGPIVDGSAGETIRQVPARIGDGWVVERVPIGVYRVSASRAGTPLLVRWRADASADFTEGFVGRFERTGPSLYALRVEVCAPGGGAPACSAFVP